MSDTIRNGSGQRRPGPVDRRSFLGLMGAAVAAPLSLPASAASSPTSPPSPVLSGSYPMTIRDVVGRSVILKGPARRIVLLDARDVVSMAVLHRDPSSRVVGWADVDRFDSDLVRHQYERRPDGSRIETVGGATADTVSVERILALAPDLVVTTAFMDPDQGQGALTRRLQDAGIPVVFSKANSNRATPTDAIRHDPFADMAHAMRLFAAILDQHQKAEDFLAFVARHRATVADLLTEVPAQKAYLEVQSTFDDCCWAAGQHVWGDLLTQAGGENLSIVEAPWYAKVALEQLMTEAPEVYIGSGGAFGAGLRPGIGPGLDPAKARAALHRLVERTGFSTLPAVRDNRVHGVWTGLLTIPPLNILFLEAAARWLHPGPCATLDPAATLTTLNQQFLAKPIQGPCWVSLNAAA